MEFIDFLKYGAIGISLALAILSYRLLSKEQDKPEVRKPILDSIRNYFLLAVFLSVFFGLLEIIPKVFFRDEAKPGSKVEEIWRAHFNEYPDSTLNQKMNRINSSLNFPETEIDTTAICSDIYKKLKRCEEDLEGFETGFYQNVIKLKTAINKDPDGWINLTFQTDEKVEIIDLLKNIFNSLGKDYSDLTNQEIVKKWQKFKSKWSDDKLGYIFDSDIAQIVKEFINTFDSN